MIPIAVAAWGGAWLGTAWGWLAGAGMALGVAVLIIAARLNATQSARPHAHAGGLWPQSGDPHGFVNPQSARPHARARGLSPQSGAANVWAHPWLVAATGAVLVGCVAIGGARAWQAETSPLHGLAADRAMAVLEGEVSGEPRTRAQQWGGTGWQAKFRLISVEARGTRYTSGEEVLLTSSADHGWKSVEVGSRLRVAAVLSEPQQTSATVAVARVRGDPEVLGGPNMLLSLVAQVRAGLKRSVPGHSPEATALVPALVVGDTSGVSADQEGDFATTGLTHLMAVSGANLTLLLGFLGLASRWLGVRGWWLRGVSIAGVVVYVLLCRADPSVIRAAAMGLVALASLGRSRVRSGMRSLAVAVAVIMTLDPWMSRSWGFALSALATGGIIWWAGAWADRLGVWLPRILAEAITLPLAAQVATLPVVAALSGQLSMVSLAANLLAGPLVGPATVLGFLAAGACLPAPAVASALGWAAGWCAQGVVWVAQVFANAPGATIGLPTDAMALIGLTAACLASAIVLPHILSRPWWSIAVLLALTVTCLLGPPRPGQPPESWRVAACDVGQGDAYLVHVGPAAAIMIDTGPEPKEASACLRQFGVSQIPVLVLTHYHADHIGGLTGVLSAARVGIVFLNPAGLDGPSANAVSAILQHAGIARRIVQTGDVADVGWAKLGVLDVSTEAPSVPGVTGEESSAENDTSIAVHIEQSSPGSVPRSEERLGVLFAGDREPTGQRRLLSRGVPKVDVLAVPHHGSRSQDAAFLSATGAAVALISVGEGNSYGHPARSTVAALEQAGMRVFRTDRQGPLAVAGTARSDLAVTTSK